MSGRREDRAPDPFQAQVERLAGQLRERGQTPERDPWPDICAGIAAAERRQFGGPRVVPWHRWAAVAAALGVLVWGAWQGVGTRGAGPVPVAASRDAAPAVGSLAAVENALDEVRAALREDPGNRSLTQIAVMLHRSRGRLLLQGDPVMRAGG